MYIQAGETPETQIFLEKYVIWKLFIQTTVVEY